MSRISLRARAPCKLSGDGRILYRRGPKLGVRRNRCRKGYWRLGAGLFGERPLCPSFKLAAKPPIRINLEERAPSILRRAVFHHAPPVVRDEISHIFRFEILLSPPRLGRRARGHRLCRSSENNFGLTDLFDLYRTRIAAFRESAPTADWAGVFVAETK